MDMKVVLCFFADVFQYNQKAINLFLKDDGLKIKIYLLLSQSFFDSPIKKIRKIIITKI